jgi:hypothetical protein
MGNIFRASWLKFAGETGKSENKRILKIEFSDGLNSFTTPVISVMPATPLLYSSDSTPTPQTLIYILNTTTTIKVKKQENLNKIEIQKHKEKIKNYAKIANIGVVSTLGTASVTSSILTSSPKPLFSMIRFFQIIGIFSKFSKINTNFGKNLNFFFYLISEIRFPHFEFLEWIKVVPSEGEQYLKYRKSDRGKITQQNEEIFIISGQFFLVVLIFFLTFLASKIFCLFFDKKWKIAKMTILASWYILDYFVYDFWMVSVSELTNRALFAKQPVVLKISLMFSFFVFQLILMDVVKGVNILEKRMSKRTRAKMEANIRLENSLLVKKYNQDFSENAKEKFPYMLVQGRIRFFAIILVISSLPMLKIAQVTTILVINLAYFRLFLKKLFSGEKIFVHKLTRLKSLASESTIMAIILLIWLIVILENSKNFKEKISNFLQILAIFFMTILGFLEIVETINYIMTHVKHYMAKRKEKLKNKGKIVPLRLGRIRGAGGVGISLKTGRRLRKSFGALREEKDQAKSSNLRSGALRMNPIRRRRLRNRNSPIRIYVSRGGGGL